MVNANRLHARQSVRDERHQRLKTRPRDGQSDDACERGQDEPFGEDLLEQPRRSCAQCGAQRHLAPPRLAAQKQQIGDIRARDQQHESHRAEQRQHGGADVPHDYIGERAHDGYEPSRGVGGRHFVQPLAQRRDLARRLLHRHPRSEPADQVDLTARRVAEGARCGDRAGRTPDLDARRVVEVRRDHPDNREGALSERDPTAEDIACTAVLPPPEAAADDDDTLSPFLVVSQAEGAAKQGFHA